MPKAPFHILNAKTGQNRTTPIVDGTPHAGQVIVNTLDLVIFFFQFSVDGRSFLTFRQQRVVEVLNRLQDGFFFLLCVLNALLFMFDFLLKLFQCPPFSLYFVGQWIWPIFRGIDWDADQETACDQDPDRVPAGPAHDRVLSNARSDTKLPTEPS